jgi:nicotinamide mononucleotide transporter
LIDFSAYFSIVWLELPAVIFGLLYLIFAAKEKLACWYFAGISSVLFIIVFIKVNYPLESLLQVFYFFMAIFGWYKWKFRAGEMGSTRKIISLTVLQNFLVIMVSLLLAAGLFYLVKFFNLTASFPILDALTTSFAVVTTFLVAYKVLENWIYWIVIDSVSIYLYANKELWFTVILFAIYLILATFGYLSWRRKFKADLP